MSAIDNFSDARVRDHLKERQKMMLVVAHRRHGPGALDAPRALAVAHEVGHVICYAAENFAVEYAEVTSYRPPADCGVGNALRWEGFTRAPGDTAPTTPRKPDASRAAASAVSSRRHCR
jgi:hypothetical protein